MHQDATLLVGVSGGADSVALLCALTRLRAQYNFTLCALHMEHGLRGESSLADQRFVTALCDTLSVPLFVQSAHLSPEEPGMEARARAARRAFFARMLRELSGDALLLAHHADDQAETVLLRLMRGSGAGGLSAMASRTLFCGKPLLRPFLSLSKQALVDALQREGVDYRTDETNLLPCCQRNRVRLSLLPVMEALEPSVKRKLCQTAERMRADDDCLTQMARELLLRAEASPYRCLLREPLRQAHEAVAIRALRLFAARELTGDEGTLSYADSRALFSLCVQPGEETLNLPCGLRAVATRRWLHLLSGKESIFPTPLSLTEKESGDFGAISLRARPALAGDRSNGQDLLLLPSPYASGALSFRSPMEGDRIQPFGMKGHKLLSRYLMDRGVDAAFRPFVPVLVSGETVLWAVGVGAAEQTRTNESREPVTVLSASGPMPWRDQ